jgi:hypothetical protein
MARIAIIILQSLFHVECLADTGRVTDVSVIAVTVSSCRGNGQRARRQGGRGPFS